ncbi:GDSL-type esterase/lipase family protein [Mucisphaera calidilacus]|uniref:SGNH hydrolase-type esterase domain-containing protein n=1 Tax=Mucisphaera calidilacus TaxID=2527982 RepID=A0A518C0K7_9BACT|nr:GDSL-type esterase/lipase family protein [Mucisphaera calidilacus]QDU72739.1 hypothetical protein Pan265_26130 [Mucisphaera calidilacus]
MIDSRLLIMSGCLVFSCVLGRHAAAYPTYAEVPYRFTQNPEVFDALFASAYMDTVRLSVIGDSQETSPGGAGAVVIPRLGYEFYQRYGNIPETQVASYSSYGGGGSVAAEMLLRNGAASPTPSQGRLSSHQVLPGMNVRAHSTKRYFSNINGQAYGQLTGLLPSGEFVSSGVKLPDDVMMFDVSGEIRAEVFAGTHPDSGGLAYAARPVDGSMSYFAPVTTSGELEMGLATETYAVRSAMTEPLDFDDKTYMAVELYGTDDDRLTDIVGMRYVNMHRPEGVVVSDLSVGGYATGTFLSRHDEAGAMYAALGFDAAVITLSANDGGFGVETDQYRVNLEQMIDRLRSWQGDSDYPVILITDPDRIELSAEERAYYDQHAGVHYEIARSMSNVMSVNLRRTLAEAYWSVDSPYFDVYSNDGVHYTAEGARLVASAMSAGILGESWRFEFEIPGDADFSGVIDGDDLPLLDYLIAEGEPAVDLNGDQMLDVLDRLVWLTEYLGVRAGDSNLDFQVDLVDLSELAGSFGGSGMWEQGDFNGDGVVDLLDLSLLAQNFDQPASVPAPSVAAVLGVLWLSSRMRQR